MGKQNLKLKTFFSRRLNPDSEVCLLESDDVLDAEFPFISVTLRSTVVLGAFFSLTGRCCWQQKRLNTIQIHVCFCVDDITDLFIDTLTRLHSGLTRLLSILKVKVLHDFSAGDAAFHRPSFLLCPDVLARIAVGFSLLGFLVYISKASENPVLLHLSLLSCPSSLGPPGLAPSSSSDTSRHTIGSTRITSPAKLLLRMMSGNRKCSGSRAGFFPPRERVDRSSSKSSGMLDDSHSPSSLDSRGDLSASPWAGASLHLKVNVIDFGLAHGVSAVRRLHSDPYAQVSRDSFGSTVYRGHRSVTVSLFTPAHAHIVTAHWTEQSRHQSDECL
ncbi:hypothetical protein EYF80_023327 [Liparis tanakae]|uniref:Uncharacterized protein n=1 Tax=Liparis tanakae TaxID=230148 RepID=A0A4Z2HKL3_9TELE|nr:hypothetical protein EYF80_023327 [Liparis tanakae]